MTGGGLLSAIPTPTSAVWWLGPFPLRAYALCILLGIVAALWIAQQRMNARGGTGDEATDIGLWAVLFGIVGARIYHVISTPQPYFGEDGNPLDALAIWSGGLGIWGAIPGGALGAWFACRRYGHSFIDFLDAAAPGILVAQALGRWGNYFNNELHGEQTDLPWGVTIHRWDGAAGEAVRDASGEAVVLGTFHPTFLYESLWCLLVALAIVLADRRIRFARGQVIALYMMGYTAGRIVFELMRTDEATMILGQRINVWVSILVFAAGLVLYLARRRTDDHPPRDDDPAEDEAVQPDIRSAGS